MATHGDGHALSYKQYFVTWFWLLVMTMLALALDYVGMPPTIKAVLLVGITLAKIVLIAAVFMHLKWERMNLVMLTFSPLVLALILFFFTYGETGMNDPTHVIMVR
jgi:cytochrome c oxidase subunit 4